MSIRKGHVQYDTTSMTFWKRQNDGDTKKISSCQGLGEGGRDERGEHRDFEGSETSRVLL